MLPRLHGGGRVAARAIAIFGAALILVSQLIGAAHFHGSAVSGVGVAVPQLNVDEGICPICQLALHSPGSVASAPVIARGPAISGTISLFTPTRSMSPVFSTSRVRAPPSAL
jgi:hypothetical protein